MKIAEIKPPREFTVGFPENRVALLDCAHIHLSDNEQITLKTQMNNEFDIAKKEWGFYATPSLNNRLIKYKLHAVLVKNRINNYYILLVEEGKEHLFRKYLDLERLEIIRWLDNTESLAQIIPESQNEQK